MAELRRRRGDAKAAIATLRSVLKEAPEKSERSLLLALHEELYRAYKDLGQFREALAEFERYHKVEREMNSEIAQGRAC